MIDELPSFFWVHHTFVAVQLLWFLITYIYIYIIKSDFYASPLRLN